MLKKQEYICVKIILRLCMYKITSKYAKWFNKK